MGDLVHGSKLLHFAVAGGSDANVHPDFSSHICGPWRLRGLLCCRFRDLYQVPCTCCKIAWKYARREDFRASFGVMSPLFIATQMGGTEMVIHHIGSLFSVTTALLTGNAHMHTIWMLVTEFTTPFINNRWWLDKMVGGGTHAPHT